MGKLYFYILGLITGLANGLFGSGGGIIAVPMLKKSGITTKESHATSLALTLPLSIVSCFFYIRNSDKILPDSLRLINSFLCQDTNKVSVQMQERCSIR